VILALRLRALLQNILIVNFKPLLKV